MISQLYQRYYHSRPLSEKIILLMTVCIFLPLYIAAPAVVICSVFLVSNGSCRRSLFSEISPVTLILPAAWAIALIVPVFYQNWFGLLCGVYFIMISVISVYIKNNTDMGLLNRACDVCCVMSVVDAGAAAVEKIISPAILVQGLTYNPNFYAFIIEFVIVITFYRLMTGRHRYYYAAVVVINLAALLFTDCRSACGALFAGLFVMFILCRKWKALAGLFGTYALFFVIVSLFPFLFPRVHEMEHTYLVRKEIWIGALNDFLHHPIFGRGFLAYLQVTHNYVTPHAHNLLIDLLECSGAVGTALAIVCFVAVIIECVRMLRSGGELRATGSLMLSCFAVTLAHGVTDMPVSGIETSLMFFVIMAMRPCKQLGVGRLARFIRLNKQPISNRKSGNTAACSKEAGT